MSYYFDVERNRYFLVTNGDQRHNSRYSNSTLRAEQRRSEYEARKSDNVLGEARASKSLCRAKTAGPLAVPLLHAKLGLRSGPPPRLLPLVQCKERRFCGRYSLWPGLDADSVFTYDKGTVSLYSIDNYLAGRPPAHQHTLTPSAGQNDFVCVDSWFPDIHAFCCHDGEYVFFAVESQCKLLRWTRTHGRHSVRDLTEKLFVRLPMSLEFEKKDMRKVSAAIENGYLQLLVEKSAVTVRLKDFRVHCQELRLEASHGKFIHNFLLYRLEGLRLLNVETQGSTVLGYRDAAHVFGKPLYVGGKVRYLRLIIVTLTDVILQDFDCRAMKVVGPKTVLSSFNDNHVLRLVSMMGNQLVVEECRGIAKLFDLDTFDVLEFKLGEVDGRMRFLQLYNHFFMSSGCETYELMVPLKLH